MSKARTQNWTQNPAGVKADILRVAVAEFAAHGLAGARVDEITAQTKTSKRMIYYYFGDKKGLYRAALEHVYAEMRASEAAVMPFPRLDVTPPVTNTYLVKAISQLSGWDRMLPPVGGQPRYRQEARQY